MKKSALILFTIAFMLASLTAGQRCAAQAAAGSSGQAPPSLPAADTMQVSAPQKAKPFQPNPKKAGLYSSIVPGLGQLYNREYWKIPVVYAGIGVAAYFINRNLTNYRSYREAYIGRINNPAPTDKYVGIYDNNQLQQLQGDYSKYLDLSVLLSVIGYGIQVLDAVTSAHLKNFDISRDISMRVSPVIVPNGGGVAMVLRFK